jgi:hypothetical protein
MLATDNRQVAPLSEFPRSRCNLRGADVTLLFVSIGISTGTSNERPLVLIALAMLNEG